MAYRFDVGIDVSGSEKLNSAAETAGSLSAGMNQVQAAAARAAAQVEIAKNFVVEMKTAEAEATAFAQEASAAKIAAEQVLVDAKFQYKKASTEADKEIAKSAIDEAQKALASQKVVMREAINAAKRAASARVRAEKEVAVQIEKSTNAQTAAMRAAASAQTGSLSVIGKAMSKLGGPVGKLGGQVGGMGATIAKATAAFGPYGVAAVAAFTLAGGAAVIAGAMIVQLVWEMTKFALQCSDAANRASALREGLTGSAAAADELGAMIQRVADTTPSSVDEVGKLADSLYKAGKRGNELEKALAEASNEAAGLGKNPGPTLLAKRMASADVVAKKWKDNINAVFAGPSTKRATQDFYGALGRIVGLFSQSAVEGRALQKVVSVIVDPFLSGIAKAEPYAKAFFRGMIIAVLDVIIWCAKLGKELGLIPPDSAIGGMITLQGAMEAGQTAVKVLIGMIIALTVAFLAVAAVIGGVVVSTFMTVAAVPLLIVAAIVGVIGALYKLVTAGPKAAGEFIAGLAGGIKSGVGFVYDAVKALAAGAISVFKAALKISSPSKVFEELGDFTVAGYVEGIDAGSNEVGASLESMISAPELASMASQSGSDLAESANAGGSGGTSISGNTFVFNGVAGMEDAEYRFSELLTRLFEGDAIAVGAA